MLGSLNRIFCLLKKYLFGCTRSQLWYIGSLFSAFGIFNCGMELLVAAYGIQFPDHGLNLGPLHWELEVLAIEQPGKSQDFLLLLKRNLPETRLSAPSVLCPDSVIRNKRWQEVFTPLPWQCLLLLLCSFRKKSQQVTIQRYHNQLKIPMDHMKLPWRRSPHMGRFSIESTRGRVVSLERSQRRLSP